MDSRTEKSNQETFLNYVENFFFLNITIWDLNVLKSDFLPYRNLNYIFNETLSKGIMKYTKYRRIRDNSKSLNLRVIILNAKFFHASLCVLEFL